LTDVNLGIIISLVALVISAISLYLSWIRFKRERPQITLDPTSGYYELSSPARNTFDKASLKIKLEVIVRNLGNARGSVTDFKMRVRYAYSVVTHPQAKDMLDTHVYSVRPMNFSEVVPFNVEEYGSKKVGLVFEFPSVFPGLLDRGILPINIRSPKKQDWNDFPIIYQLTASTPTGPVSAGGGVFRNDQPESKEVSGSLRFWEEWKLEREFSPLKYYKNP